MGTLTDRFKKLLAKKKAKPDHRGQDEQPETSSQALGAESTAATATPPAEVPAPAPRVKWFPSGIKVLRTPSTPAIVE